MNSTEWTTIEQAYVAVFSLLATIDLTLVVLIIVREFRRNKNNGTKTTKEL